MTEEQYHWSIHCIHVISITRYTTAQGSCHRY